MKPRWSPKISLDKLHILYTRYMQGTADPALVDDIGLGLLLRCEDICLIAAKKCRCSACGQVFDVADTGGKCACGFAVSWEEYHNSWKKRELWCGGALPCFEKYLADYPRCCGMDEKMIAIDTLIHSFHLDIKSYLPNRAAANNLLEGSLSTVMAALDNLSGIQPENDARFAVQAERMWKRRRGQL